MRIDIGAKPVWKDYEIKKLGELIKRGKLNPEIAIILNRPRSSVAIKTHQYFGGNPNYMKQKTKHKHLRKRVMEYFLTHSFEETAKMFDLTLREMKSLQCVSYKDPELDHLRKDTRRRDAWSTEDYLFLLRHAGLKPRKWIGEKLKRGKEVVIKEKLQQLGVASKNIQGLTLSQYRKCFETDHCYAIQTKAGPSGVIHTHFQIVPWFVIWDMLTMCEIKTVPQFKKIVKTMCLFQYWIHGDDPWESMIECVNRK